MDVEVQRSYVASMCIPMGFQRWLNDGEVVRGGSNGGESRVLVRGSGMIWERAWELGGGGRYLTSHIGRIGAENGTGWRPPRTRAESGVSRGEDEKGRGNSQVPTSYSSTSSPPITIRPATVTITTRSFLAGFILHPHQRISPTPERGFHERAPVMSRQPERRK